MRSHPLLISTVAGTLVLASKVVAAANTGPELTNVADLNWPGLAKEAGTIAVLVWMVTWFQKRMEAKDLVVQTLTENALNAINKLADAQIETAKSLDRLAQAVKDK